MIDWRIGVLVDTQRGGGGEEEVGASEKSGLYSVFLGDTHH